MSDFLVRAVDKLNPAETFLTVEDVPEPDFQIPPDGDDSVHASNNGAGFGPTPSLIERAPNLSVALKKRTRVVPFLHLLKQTQSGKPVLALQRALNKSGAKLRADGVFGGKTTIAVKNFQRAHKLHVDGIYGRATHTKLAPYYDAYGIWLLHHTIHPKPKPVPVPATNARQRIVGVALFGAAHAWQIHYTQSAWRMYGVRHHLHPPSVPFYEDCSSFATWCYYVAGLKDPNFLGYNGEGFTGTLSARGHVTSNPQPGDLGFYGWYPHHHVVIYIGNGRCVSHGSEIGPLILPPFYRSDFNRWVTFQGILF